LLHRGPQVVLLTYWICSRTRSSPHARARAQADNDNHAVSLPPRCCRPLDVQNSCSPSRRALLGQATPAWVVPVALHRTCNDLQPSHSSAGDNRSSMAATGQDAGQEIPGLVPLRRQAANRIASLALQQLACKEKSRPGHLGWT
jgi:hypothetical protein